MQNEASRSAAGMKVNASIRGALRALQVAEQSKRRELAELEALTSRLRSLVGEAPPIRAAADLEFVGLGPTEGARRLLEKKGPLTTRDLVDMMSERGWTTRSSNPVATVYATLEQAKKKFRRNDAGQWELLV